MNKNVPFIWRVNYRNEVTPPEKCSRSRTKRRANICRETSGGGDENWQLMVR